MFILRKITGNGVEENFALGDSYSLILKDTNPNHFNEVLEINGHDRFKGEIYGFIAYELRYLMLFTDDYNYIMTESGKTFKNITNPYRAEKSNKEEIDGNHTKLSDHFSKLMSQQLKSSLNTETVEEANKLTDDELLMVPGFGKIALQRLRRLKNND